MKKCLFALLLASSFVNAAPLDDLAGGQVGRIEYASITPHNRWEYVREFKKNTTAAVVWGDLVMPKTINGKVGAVVLMHGSLGVRPDQSNVWLKQLNEAGYATFVVDSFKPRGISETDTNQAQLDVSANIADGFYALKLLASHPQIDRNRIAIMGYSRGGQVTYESYWDTARRPIIKDDLKFAAHIAVYPGGCTVRTRLDRGNTNNVPMLALLGGKDVAHGGVENCTNLYKDVNEKSGANVKWKIYPNAYHGFDGFSKWHVVANAESFKDCSLEVFVDPKRAGLGEARNFKTGAAINSWDEWTAARKSCIGKGRADGGDESVRREAVKDVLEFLKDMK